MLIMVVLSVFIAGLMVGRTPEYLGKKIEAYDVKMTMLYVLIFPLIILTFTAIFVLSPPSASAAWPTRGRTGSPRSSTPSPRRQPTTARLSPALNANTWCTTRCWLDHAGRTLPHAGSGAGFGRQSGK